MRIRNLNNTCVSNEYTTGKTKAVCSVPLSTSAWQLSRFIMTTFSIKEIKASRSGKTHKLSVYDSLCVCVCVCQPMEAVVRTGCWQCCGSGSGIRCLFDPGIRDGRKSASGSGIRDEQPGSYFLELKNQFFCFLGVKILKFSDADPGWRQFGFGIRDGKKSDPGSGIKIPNPQHWMLGWEQYCGSASLSCESGS
jgi:hypothetical protein